MQGSSNPQTNLEKQKEFALNILNDYKMYFDKKMYKKMASDAFNTYSLIDRNDKDRIRFSQIFKKMKEADNFDFKMLNLTQTQSRGIAAVLGMGICDALGASTEFMEFFKEGYGLIENGFKDIEILTKKGQLSARSGKVGIWTDDASMGIAMAFSVLLNNYNFNPVHIRYMFTLWLEHGLGNGGRPHSIGLGGNISISMGQFMQQQTPYAETGSQFNNGNGSLMRLATIPVAYSDNLENSIQYSGLQSKTTHNGLQAQECCRLMARILVRLINRGQQKDWKKVIEHACLQFKSDVTQVQYLAQSKQQTQQMYDMKAHQTNPNSKSFRMYNKSVQDRNWNWKSVDYTYAPTRTKQQPGYIGSYCMDAFSMALHTVWHSKSFKQCALINANMGGDCDTVGSIAGQIAGAIYGVDDEMLRLYSEMVDFTSQRYEVFLLGYKLINKLKLGEYGKQSSHMNQNKISKAQQNQKMQVQ